MQTIDEKVTFRLDQAWLNKINKEAIADLGVRYTPKLNIKLDIAKIFDGIGRTQVFIDKFYTHIDNFLIKGNKLGNCDAIAAYSHIRNEYEPNMMESYSQNGYGLSASLEGGYAYNIDQTNWTLMPQAQLIYHYLDLKNKQIAQGELKGVSGSTWLGRVGGQAIYNIDDTKKAYFGVDYWHRFNDNPSVAWGNSVFEENYGKNWFEVSVGGQYKISNRVNIFGDISYQNNIGGEKIQSYTGNIGIRIDL